MHCSCLCHPPEHGPQSHPPSHSPPSLSVSSSALTRTVVLDPPPQTRHYCMGLTPGKHEPHSHSFLSRLRLPAPSLPATPPSVCSYPLWRVVCVAPCPSPLPATAPHATSCRAPVRSLLSRGAAAAPARWLTMTVWPVRRRTGRSTRRRVNACRSNRQTQRRGWRWCEQQQQQQRQQLARSAYEVQHRTMAASYLRGCTREGGVLPGFRARIHGRSELLSACGWL